MRASTIERWSRVVADFEASGLSAARFCEARRLSAATFFMNRRKLRRAAEQGRARGPVFVEAVITAERGLVAAERELVVECRGGRRVIVPRGFDEPTLARVVGVLEHGSHERGSHERGSHGDGAHA